MMCKKIFCENAAMPERESRARCKKKEEMKQ